MREKHDGDTISLTLPISFSLCLSIYLSIYRFLVSIYIISIFYTFTLSLMYKKKLNQNLIESLNSLRLLCFYMIKKICMSDQICFYYKLALYFMNSFRLSCFYMIQNYFIFQPFRNENKQVL